MPVNVQLLKEEALALAVQMGHHQFKASNCGWRASPNISSLLSYKVLVSTVGTFTITVLTRNYTPFKYKPPYFLLKCAAEVYLSLI